MQRKWFLVGLLVLVMPWLIGGCGVAKDVYDTALADLNKAQQEIQSLKADLGTAQAKVAELTSSLGSVQAKNSELTANLGKTQTGLDTAKATNSDLTSSLGKSQSELQTTKSDYSSFKTDVKQMYSSLDASLELNNYVLGINNAILKNDLDEIRKGCLLVTARLAIGDAELKSLWESAYVVTGDKWTLSYTPFRTFMSMHASRISAKAKALRDKLAQ
jgi:molybdopterin converting factor small subunit